MLHTFRLRSNCEIEAKFIQNHIQFVEKNLSELGDAFSQYSQKAGRIRDKTTDISKIISNYAETENINKSLSTGLESFADSLSTLSEYSDNRVQSLDTKVVGELAKYKDICKHAKEEVKEIYSVRDKEVNRKKQLNRIRDKNPRNRQQIIQAETEFVKATARVSKSIHNLEEKTNAFEKQKLHDIKSTLLDFIAIEIAYHVNSLEVLTKAYDEVDSINEDSDLEQFKKTLRLPDPIHHKSPRRRPLFRSGGKFGSLGAIFSSNHNKRSSGSLKSKEMSKSQETLDSTKHISSEAESDESQSESGSSSDEKHTKVVRK